jgi:sulfur-oxidizing protein SoxY
MMRRRQLVLAPAAALLCRPAHATPATLQAAIEAFTGGAPLREGRIRLDVSTLVENGNTVPVSLSLDGAGGSGTSDAVRRMALFTERNPRPDVAVFEFGPLAGAPRVATRMRLATSQTLVAVAQMVDGSFWQHRVQVIVTLAACVEGG